ncbi:AtpZ/AtpI family protein [Nocardioides bruguierae]|uniref:AtpZ/AtpI family protein n=1 Tax=Nocardioides bruguierae TaxID=2945102 RepID=A0A9X2D4Q4_9ACTN|nr:AtpZ/AtpI family protein [Nocardioides bruguierae]MCL8024783.1 AtpZ/AtpI family protein [Nocardioides bruguierae]MCM0619188.1 AtpZ/AtpI family protein [Nocardioides bruguierae]
MARHDTPARRPDPSVGSGSGGDPWSAFGYLVAGVFVYGGIGWGLDRWWGTGWLVAVGVIVGAALGTYQTWARFRTPEEEPAEQHPGSTDPDTNLTGEPRAGGLRSTDDQTQ